MTYENVAHVDGLGALDLLVFLVAFTSLSLGRGGGLLVVCFAFRHGFAEMGEGERLAGSE